MFNSIKYQISLFFFVTYTLLSSFKSLLTFLFISSNPASIAHSVTFFGYSSQSTSFLESFNLMYYYSMPVSIAIVLKKRLNLIFLFVSCFSLLLFFL